MLLVQTVLFRLKCVTGYSSKKFVVYSIHLDRCGGRRCEMNLSFILYIISIFLECTCCNCRVQWTQAKLKFVDTHRLGASINKLRSVYLCPVIMPPFAKREKEQFFLHFHNVYKQGKAWTIIAFNE